MVVGVLFKHYFEDLRLQPVPILLGLAVGGLGILLVEHGHKEKGAASVETTTLRQALGVGLFQCLALWPGVSRSGATIIAGLLLGLNRRAAAEFSFLIGVPVFAAAAALQVAGHDSRGPAAGQPAGPGPGLCHGLWPGPGHGGGLHEPAGPHLLQALWLVPPGPQPA